MSSPAPRVISEYAAIKFDVCDKSWTFKPEEVSGFVLGLQTSADKATLQFKEVVACRTLVLIKPDNSLDHNLAIWSSKGPFTSEQFLGMIKCKVGISDNDWSKHLNDSSRVSVVSS